MIDKQLMEKWIVDHDLDKPEEIAKSLRLVRHGYRQEIDPRSLFLHKAAAAFAFIANGIIYVPALIVLVTFAA